jgi:hypothetical protein
MLKAYLQKLREEDQREPASSARSSADPMAGEEIEGLRGAVGVGSLQQPVQATVVLKRKRDDEDEGSLDGEQKGAVLPDFSGDESSEGDDEQAAATRSFAMRRLLRQRSETSVHLDGAFALSFWWATCIRDSVATRWDRYEALYDMSLCPMQFDSFCVGLGVEMMASQALGIPIDADCTASEIKDVCRDYLGQNALRYKHVYESMGDQALPRAYCTKHANTCPTSVGRGRQVDLLVGGTPCQPFTALQTGGDCRSHPLFNATFGDPSAPHGDPLNSLMHLVRASLPSALLLEQVEGFGNHDAALDDRPISILITQLLSVLDTAGNQHFHSVKVFSLNSNTWVNMSRPRSAAQHLQSAVSKPKT